MDQFKTTFVIRETDVCPGALSAMSPPLFSHVIPHNSVLMPIAAVCGQMLICMVVTLQQFKMIWIHTLNSLALVMDLIFVALRKISNKEPVRNAMRSDYLTCEKANLAIASSSFGCLPNPASCFSVKFNVLNKSVEQRFILWHNLVVAWRHLLHCVLPKQLKAALDQMVFADLAIEEFLAESFNAGMSWRNQVQHWAEVFKFLGEALWSFHKQKAARIPKVNVGTCLPQWRRELRDVVCMFRWPIQGRNSTNENLPRLVTQL